MEPLRTLFDRIVPSKTPILPADLRRHYGGDLALGAAREDRPYVVANFVSTLDGVVSFTVPGHAGGADISGHNEEDRFIMGLLRASADAVIVGSSTLHATDPDHLWTAESICPGAAELYKNYRKGVLGKADSPHTVIASASGAIDLDRATFHAPNITVHIITTPRGRERLEGAGVHKLGTTQVAVLGEPDDAITPGAILQFLRTTLGVRLLLHEGGPTLFGEFVAAGLVDEFFLTLAPQIAGRSAEHPRPGMIAEAEFLPETAPWLRILSVKQSGSHLYLRYASVGATGRRV